MTLTKDLKNAPEGSRKLSDRFLEAMGWKYQIGPNYDYWLLPDGSKWRISENVPNCSQSIDDARAFVPEGWRFCLEFGDDGDPVYWTAWPPGFSPFETEHQARGGKVEGKDAEARALCIAILEEKRARDGMEADK